MDSEQKTWLVTGANGFLGSNTPRYLSSKIDLLAATRTGLAPQGFSGAITLDLTDVESSKAAITQARPTVILHSAAMANHESCEKDPALAHEVNAVATEQLARIAEHIGAVFVYISTDAVFEGAKGEYSESDAVSPFSVYGETKLAGEIAALAETKALIIRTNFFGWSPGGSRSILEFFVNNLSERNPVRGYTDFTVTSIYAGDLLEQIEALVNAGASGIFHVASRDALSKYEFGNQVATVFDLDSHLISPHSAAGTHETSRVRDLSLSTALISRTLGHPMPSQTEGIERARADRAQ